MLSLHAGLLLLLYSSLTLATKKNLIIDTDLYSDVDDAGALLLAATIPNINLLAVNINYPSTFSALAASAILSHYGRGDVPIGITRPLTNITFFDSWKYELGEYASKIAYHWSGGSLKWGEAEKAWDPVKLYRKVLAEARDRSVTIASIGFLDNLSALLNSTSDSYSPLSGRDLVNKKVAELIIMGSNYPGPGRSWNFWGSNSSFTAHVINTWNGPMTFIGADVGKHVLTGGPLMASSLDTDPVRMAYIYYMYHKPRSSWDPLTVLYAADGLGKLFKTGNEYGRNFIEPDGTNRWINDKAVQNQHFLRLKVSNETAAAEVDKLFMKGAAAFANKLKDKATLGEEHDELGFFGWMVFILILVTIFLGVVGILNTGEEGN